MNRNSSFLPNIICKQNIFSSLCVIISNRCSKHTCVKLITNTYFDRPQRGDQQMFYIAVVTLI